MTVEFVRAYAKRFGVTALERAETLAPVFRLGVCVRRCYGTGVARSVSGARYSCVLLPRIIAPRHAPARAMVGVAVLARFPAFVSAFMPPPTAARRSRSSYAGEHRSSGLGRPRRT